MTDLVSQYIKKGLHSLYYAFYVIIEPVGGINLVHT